ncbi:C-C motif chemokine 24 [Tupaia chinensis]|uniref:C-C motif chemokine 24 n=1 Tax=Tupaia chinensis TaxID=246437 RepID=L9K0W1_TUPCH|nr:C-C motif chemokine 24 [Tupaia chinensis]XP_014446061.1 C-C motif chemokine 24 [Tupaia chinensis]XP_027630449.1 C-C motif chemokine 24 [Tupaia chinensis]ELW56430.1 C-C motif chemokine 24 [Tupaia chinensis]
MAGPTTIAASLLLLALCAHYLALTGSVIIPSSCCLNFISKKFPENRVVSYQLSNRSVCPQAGVIFTTRKGQKFCGDPEQQWVQKYMKNLDAKQKKASSGVRAKGTKVPLRKNPGKGNTL